MDDETRGRTFAFLQAGIRVILIAVIAVSPFLAAGFAAVTGSNTLRVGRIAYHAIGYNMVLLLAAAIAIWLGVVSYRHMDDRRGVPLREDLLAAVRGGLLAPIAEDGSAAIVAAAVRSGTTIPLADGDGAALPEGARAALSDGAAAGYADGAGPGRTDGGGPPRQRGVFIAVEGGEGAGKTTQARLLAIWLREQGYDVVTTREPGATKIGMRLRALLLDTAHAGLSPRAEALMYAADRAEHVETVIRPALARGAVVVSDRYADSSVAYQAHGRKLPPGEIAGLNAWATGGLVPDLTVLLDVQPATGLSRRAPSADRLEAEPADFHDRVRRGFLAQAAAEPGRYLVLDASRPAAELSAEIADRLRALLPDPVPPVAEASTGSLPAIVE